MDIKKKAYVCFDPDNDLHCWNVMKAWIDEEGHALNFQNGNEIHLLQNGDSEALQKRKMREHMHGAKSLIILIGNNTLNLIKYIKWEVEHAIDNDIPIIAVNLNTRRKQDDLCPQILKKELVLYIAFGQKILDLALHNWPESHALYKEENKIGPYHYFDSVYAKLWHQYVK